MGSVISKAANDLGGVVGNAFVAPFKSIFGGSCEDVCSRPWDVICFIEHLCVSSLVKLSMILVLCYITLLFFYLLFKLGICQCIGRSLCKMCWAACEAYCFALQDITCFLWHKLINTKRVNRRRRHRFHDVELGGYSSSSSSTDQSDPSISPSANYSHNIGRKRKSLRERRNKYRLRNYFYSSTSKAHGIGSLNYHHARLKERSPRLRNSRQFQLSRARNQHGKAKIFKRRRLK